MNYFIYTYIKKFRIKQKHKKITLETKNPNSGLKITVWEPTINKEISVSHALSRLINSGLTLTTIFYVKNLNSPSTYFIHCNLIDKNQNFLNNNKSDLLAKSDIKGKPYEKVSNDSSPQQPFRDCSTDSHVNSITVSVRNHDGELFDFNGFPRICFGNKINFYLPYLLVYKSNSCVSRPPIFKVKNQIFHHFWLEK